MNVASRLGAMVNPIPEIELHAEAFFSPCGTYLHPTGCAPHLYAKYVPSFHTLLCSSASELRSGSRRSMKAEFGRSSVMQCVRSSIYAKRFDLLLRRNQINPNNISGGRILSNVVVLVRKVMFALVLLCAALTSWSLLEQPPPTKPTLFCTHHLQGLIDTYNH